MTAQLQAGSVQMGCSGVTASQMSLSMPAGVMMLSQSKKTTPSNSSRRRSSMREAGVHRRGPMGRRTLAGEVAVLSPGDDLGPPRHVMAGSVLLHQRPGERSDLIVIAVRRLADDGREHPALHRSLSPRHHTSGPSGILGRISPPSSTRGSPRCQAVSVPTTSSSARTVISICDPGVNLPIFSGVLSRCSRSAAGPGRCVQPGVRLGWGAVPHDRL